MSARIVLMCDPDYEPDEGDMKFTLTYEGRLLGASRSDPRPKHKHEIRQRFHPQHRSNGHSVRVSGAFQSATSIGVLRLQIDEKSLCHRRCCGVALQAPPCGR